MINQTNQTISTILGHTVPISSSPTIDIYLITVLVSLFMTLTNKYLSDQVAIKALRKEMKELQAKMKKVMRKDPKKAQMLQKEIMKKNLENMKYTMNPKIMLFTLLPMILVFSFIRKYYSHLGEFFNVFGLTHFGWLGTYILFSIINSIILKKLLDVA